MRASQRNSSRYVSQRARLYVTRILAVVMTGAVPGVPQTGAVRAQGVSETQLFDGRAIETVRIRIDTPSTDVAFNTQIEERVRRELDLFHGATYCEDRIGFALKLARSNPAVKNIDDEGLPSSKGGVDLTVTVQLRDGAHPVTQLGMAATGYSADFLPILDHNSTYLRFKLDAFPLYCANNDPLYGQPELILAGDPRVQGTPSGRGYDNLVKDYLHYGFYGRMPIGEQLSFYSGLSAISSGSSGQELFTDRTRSYTYLKDAL